MAYITFRIKPEAKEAFSLWQAKLHEVSTQASGFLSLQLLAPNGVDHEWRIIHCFRSRDDELAWNQSDRKNALFKELSPLVNGPIDETARDKTSVTEVFVTEVAKDQEEAYKRWLIKVNAVESKFEGFQGVYYQFPMKEGSKNWLTLLHFDTKEHLDIWLSSDERRNLLAEATPFINSLDSHHIHAGFSGWFTSGVQKPIPVWKQTALILLVLYPIVMLEIRFLNPHLTHLSQPLSIFIGNVISVSLISWPLMPIAIRCLNWWLETEKWQTNIYGSTFILFLYLLEILAFS